MNKIKINRRLVFRASFWVMLLDLTILRQPFTLSGVVSFCGLMMFIDPVICWILEVDDQ